MKKLLFLCVCLIASPRLLAQVAAPEVVVESVVAAPQDTFLTVRTYLRHHGPPTRYFKPCLTPDGGVGEAACFTLGWLVVTTADARPDTVGFFPCYLTSHVICTHYTPRNTVRLREGQKYGFTFRVPSRRLRSPHPATLLFGMALAYDNLADGQACSQYHNKLRVYEQRIEAKPLRVEIK